MEILESTVGVILCSLVGLLLTCLLLYYIIKIAINDAYKELKGPKKESPGLTALQSKFDKGEITFDEYIENGISCERPQLTPYYSPLTTP